MEQPKMTSFKIVNLQHELVALMEAAAASETDDELAAHETRMEQIYEHLADTAEEKLSALRHIAKRLEAEEQMLKDEAKVIAQARRSHAKAVDRVKRWATSLMDGVRATKGVSKLQHDGRTFWLAKTWKLSGPEDVDDWPPAWQRTKTTVEPDRVAARDALKDGVPTPDGFTFEQVEGIRWR